MTAIANFTHDPATGQTEKQLFNITFSLLTFAALTLFGMSSADPNDFRWLWIIALSSLSLLQMSAGVFMREKISLDETELALLTFIVYAALSLAWSPDPLAGKALLSKLLLLVTVFLCVKNSGNDEWFRWLCTAIALSVAGVLGMIVSGIGGAGAYGGYGNRNFVSEYLILAVPFIATLIVSYKPLAIRFAAALLIAADLVYLIFFNPSKIEFIVIAGIAAAALIHWGWKHSRWIVVAGLVVITAAIAALVAYLWSDAQNLSGSHGFRASLYPRLALIINSLLMWLDHPFFGSGAGGFNYLYALYQERQLAWLDVGTEMLSVKQVSAGAAHNEFIQLLATFGLIGGAIVAGFAYFVLRSAWGRARSAYAWAGLVATGIWLINALVEFPLQNPATALLAAIALGFLTNGKRETTPTSGYTFTLNLNQATGLLLLLGSVALSGLAGYGGYRFAAANQHYLNAVVLLNVNPARSYAENLEAYQLYPWDTTIRNQLYVTTTRWYELTGKPPLPPAELDQVFKVSISSSPNTLLLLARLQYLCNTRLLLQDARYASEAKQWIELVRKNASRTADVQVVDTYYSVLLGDYPAAHAALERSEKLALSDLQKKILDSLRQELAKREPSK